MSSRARLALPLLTLVALAALLVAVLVGSGQAGLRTLVGAVTGDVDPLELRILADLRLARALAAFGTGAALAVAGVLMQVLLRNPLADPYILGTSGGAAVAALALMLAGAAPLVVDLGAFAGAIGVTFLVFALAQTTGGWHSSRLLLTGVVIAAACGAAISLLLAISPEAGLRGVLFWLMGDFAYVTDARPALAVAATGTITAFAFGRSLDVLATGTRQGALLGLEVPRLRLGIYGLGSLLTAVAVTTAGIVGFVGLVVPHLVRMLAGSNHRVVVPGSALAGGTLLVMADMLARTLLAPRQLPVGAITAAVGVPVFLFLLARSVPGADVSGAGRGNRGHAA